MTSAAVITSAVSAFAHPQQPVIEGTDPVGAVVERDGEIDRQHRLGRHHGIGFPPAPFPDQRGEREAEVEQGPVDQDQQQVGPQPAPLERRGDLAIDRFVSDGIEQLRRDAVHEVPSPCGRDPS
ncbi:MAG: hypothetical protein ACK4E5_00860 [Erythrobacter cryptus]